MNRKNWRENWLKSINELTSFEIQKKTWLDFENTNPHWSFIEFISCYFDDLVISENYDDEIKTGLVTKEEYETIKEWHNLIAEYKAPNNDNYNHEKILEDKIWVEILKIGEKAKRDLSGIINKTEKKILEKEINVA